MDDKPDLENKLLEIAREGIKGYDPSNPLSVFLVWDTKGYERVVRDVVGEGLIEDLAAKSDGLPQNIAQLNPNDLIGFLVDKDSYWGAIRDFVATFNVLPQDIGKLTPVQLTALIIYTLPDRLDDEGLSSVEYLQLLGNALDLYRTIYNASETHIPQGEYPLMFFRETFPGMIKDSGYVPASVALYNLAQKSISTHAPELNGEEVSTVIRNIRNNPDIADTVQDFKVWEGMQTFIYTIDSNEQLAETIWRSVPRFIEAKGYIPFTPADWPYMAAEIEAKGPPANYIEGFEETVDGNVHYIMPGREGDIQDYEDALAYEEKSAERSKRRALDRAEARRQQQPVRPVTQPLPKTEPEIVPEDLEKLVEESDVPVPGAETEQEEYRHPVYGHLDTLRTYLKGLAAGRRENRGRVLETSNSILDYVRHLSEDIGSDVVRELRDIVNSSSGIKKGDKTAWRKIKALQASYVNAYDGLVSRIAYKLRIHGR